MKGEEAEIEKFRQQLDHKYINNSDCRYNVTNRVSLSVSSHLTTNFRHMLHNLLATSDFSIINLQTTAAESMLNK